MSPTSRTLLALTASLIAACARGGDEDPPEPTCQDSLIPGDLVITEVLANPAGDDDGNEWFEIYNASSSDLPLGGIELVIAKPDGTGEKVHAMGELSLRAGDYLVVGDVLPELRPEYVDYGYANALGSLANAGGRIALRCGGTELDALEYPEAPGTEGGVSIILDGNVAPDHLANDDASNLCPSSTASAAVAGMTASPGEANEPCNVVVPGTCLEDGVARAPVSPVPGDLVISELMPSPDAVADAAGEWFEVYVASTVDLNGVVLGRAPGSAGASIDSPDCVTAPAGSYLLFARESDPAFNGGLPIVDASFNFSLVAGSEASPGGLYVGVGDVVLDQISWTATDSGAALALAADRLDDVSNDDPAAWTSCGAPYGDGDKGTPRAANDTCSTPVDQCRDGGSFRPIVAPGAGDLVVSEALPNAFANGADGAQEWFEVEVNAAVDLNGLEIGKQAEPYTVADTLSSVDCLRVEAGDRLVFAHEESGNGGLPAVDFTFAMAMTDSNSGVFVGVRGAALSSLRWTTTRAGKARAVNPAGGMVCDAEAAYGDAGNVGSPGAANPASTTQCVAP